MKSFREDLPAERGTITLLPLRERRQDIPSLSTFLYRSGRPVSMTPRPQNCARTTGQART